MMLIAIAWRGRSAARPHGRANHEK